VAQIPSSNDPLDDLSGPRKDRSGSRKPGLPSPGDSGMLQRRLPVWDAARRLQGKESPPEEGPAAGEDPLSEELLFEEELGDLDLPSAGATASGQVESALYTAPPIQPTRSPVINDSRREAELEQRHREAELERQQRGAEVERRQREAELARRHRQAELDQRQGDAKLPPSSQPMLAQRRIPESDQRGQDRGQLQGEDAWTGRQAVSLWWILAGAVCIAIVWVFLSSSFNTPINPARMEEPERLEMNEDMSNVPVADFVARAAEILPEVGNVLDSANSAGGPELAQFIRGGEESWARREAWAERKPSASRGHYPLTKRQLHAASSRQHAYLILVGMDSDHLEAVAYFVSDDDGNFKYDWEASEGYSELLPGEVNQLTGKEPKLMRGIILPSSFYTPSFPEEEFQCYTVHHRDPGEFVWVFARRSSEANKRVMGHFNSQAIGGTLGRVTVRVRKGPEGARSNQLELVEFLNSDWFMPTVTPKP